MYLGTLKHYCSHVPYEGEKDTTYYNVLTQDLRSDPLNTDDFGTEEDDAAKAKQQLEAEEKEKRSVRN